MEQNTSWKKSGMGKLNGSLSPTTWLTTTTFLDTLHTHHKQNDVPICFKEISERVMRPNFEVSNLEVAHLT